MLPLFQEEKSALIYVNFLHNTYKRALTKPKLNLITWPPTGRRLCQSVAKNNENVDKRRRLQLELNIDKFNLAPQFGQRIAS